MASNGEIVVEIYPLPVPEFRKYCKQFRADLEKVRLAHVDASERYWRYFYIYSTVQLVVSAALSALQGLGVAEAVVIIIGSVSGFIQSLDKVLGLQAKANGHTTAAKLYRAAINDFDHKILHKIMETAWDGDGAAEAFQELKQAFYTVMQDIDELARTVPVLPQQYQVSTLPFIPEVDDPEMSNRHSERNPSKCCGWLR